MQRAHGERPFAPHAGVSLDTAAGSMRRFVVKWLRAGRIAYGAALPVFGTLHLIYPANVAGLIPPWYPLPMFWAYCTGIAQIAGGIAIAANVLPASRRHWRE